MNEVLTLDFLSPQVSTAEIREACGFTRRNIWHLLHENEVHLCHATLVQALMLDDHVKHLIFVISC